MKQPKRPAWVQKIEKLRTEGKVPCRCPDCLQGTGITPRRSATFAATGPSVSLPLLGALFDGARDMMWAAACAAVQPRANFGRPPAAATNYLDGVRLGQTEGGSYVVTVISDVTPPAQQALVPDEAAHMDVPFERQVTTRLIEALGATHSAATRVLVQHASVSETFEEVVEQGVSANLCAAITRISEEQVAANVEVSVDWASSRPPTTEYESAVAFEPSTLPVLQEAVTVLRQLGPFENEVIEGFVTRLNRGKEEEAIGSIVIEGTAQGARRNVHVELPTSNTI